MANADKDFNAVFIIAEENSIFFGRPYIRRGEIRTENILSELCDRLFDRYFHTLYESINISSAN